MWYNNKEKYALIPETVYEPELIEISKPQETEETMTDDTQDEPVAKSIGKISITVYDLENQPLRGVIVSSTTQPTGQSTLSLVIYSDGNANFDEILAGNYVLRLMKTGYESQTLSGGIEMGESLFLSAFLEENAEKPDSTDWILGYPSLAILLGITSLIFHLNRSHKYEKKRI